MILLTLIKKEIIEFFSNKTYLITMFIFPILMILLIGSVMDENMSNEKNIFADKIIYFNANNLGADNKNVKMFYDFMSIFQKSTNVSFKQVENKESGIEYVKNNEAICFVDIYSEDYEYYRNENKECSESKIFRNIFEQYLKKYLLIISINNKNEKDIQLILSEEVEILLEEEGVEIEEIDSYTYYTFVELTLIILCISGITCTSMYKERFPNTCSRFKALKPNYKEIVLSKIFLGIVVGILQTMSIFIVSRVFLQVNWGHRFFEIFLVLLSLIIFSSSFGIFMSMIIYDEKIACSINNILIIVMGLLGGAYCPIFVVKSSKLASILCEFMPTYWTNISLISTSYNIDNYYPAISIIIILLYL